MAGGGVETSAGGETGPAEEWRPAPAEELIVGREWRLPREWNGGNRMAVVKAVTTYRKLLAFEKISLKPGEGYVQDFLQQNAEDIARCFPERRPQEWAPNRAYMVFHGSEPAGILLGREEDGVLNVGLDYSTPAYRDCSVGEFLLENLPRPLRICYGDAEEEHLPYLKKLGFSNKDISFED